MADLIAPDWATFASRDFSQLIAGDTLVGPSFDSGSFSTSTPDDSSDGLLDAFGASTGLTSPIEAGAASGGGLFDIDIDIEGFFIRAVIIILGFIFVGVGLKFFGALD